VTVTLQASESPSGIAAYALSNDGATWTTTAVSGCTVGQVAACGSSLDAQVPWTLTPGPGTKTVYAKVESTAGVWSAVATATVYVEPDEQAPTVDLTLDGGAASTGSTTATVATTITAPLAGQAGLTFQARYSTDGGQTWTAWQDEGSATSWTATVALPGGASGERTVLEQVEDSDQNLGQGGAAIYYAAPGAGTGAGAAESGASLPCTWPVGGKDVSATCIAQPQVDLSLSPPSSAVLMRASLDGADWGAWVPVAGSLPVNLGSAPGLKTVWVQYQDALGDVTADPAFDPAYYVLDPGPPTVQASWLGGASATDSSGGATLQVQATDPVGTTGMTLAVSENGTYLYRGAFEGMVPLTLTGSGYQQVQVTVTDAAGNAATASLGIYVQ
jgi:hypothetical protein